MGKRGGTMNGPIHCPESLWETSYLCVPVAGGQDCHMLAISDSSKIGNLMSYTVEFVWEGTGSMQNGQGMKTGLNNRLTSKDKRNNNKTGLGKGTERKGAEKSRIKGAGRIAVWRQRRKASQPWSVTPQGSRLHQAIRSTISCHSQMRSKGSPGSFQRDTLCISNITDATWSSPKLSC